MLDTFILCTQKDNISQVVAEDSTYGILMRSNQDMSDLGLLPGELASVSKQTLAKEA